MEGILKQLKVLEDREIPYDFVAMNAHSLEEEENITIQHKFHSEELIYSLKPEKYFGKIDVLKLNNYLISCFFERRIYDN